eukprot:TRINITY_DN10811_c0_g1_i1.p1 TRINITY_DN10811_c0_g1~~TRINITY_DN10811_c0_g1_i1.p1  ORF type:complete len:348 (-),score=68.01 TRINITY_DN10811_c0_g1_i1:495-1538(-)
MSESAFCFNFVIEERGDAVMQGTDPSHGEKPVSSDAPLSSDSTVTAKICPSEELRITDEIWSERRTLYLSELFEAVPLSADGTVVECSGIEDESEGVVKLWKAISPINFLVHEKTSSATTQPNVDEAASRSDLVPGVYEGGFKLWEGAMDLVRYMKESGLKFRGATVLEAGCGHGLPGLLALLSGARVHFQDYNREVLERVTIPNVMRNIVAFAKDDDEVEEIRQRARFFSGDWNSFNELLTEIESTEDHDGEAVRYDWILSTETIYHVHSHADLLSLLCTRLRQPRSASDRGGAALFAQKTYYFSCGGGTQQFKDLLAKTTALKIACVKNLADGASNVREILSITQ